MQTVLSLFVDSMQKAKHMYANCVNLSGRQFAKSLVCKKLCMQVALCLVVDSVQKGVKLSCSQYVQDVKINHKIVFKKKFSLLVHSMQKALSLVVDSVQKTSRLVVDRENVKLGNVANTLP